MSKIFTITPPCYRIRLCLADVWSDVTFVYELLTVNIHLIVRCHCLSAVGRTPAVTKEFIELGEISQTKLSKIVNITHSSADSLSSAMMLSEHQPDNDVGCRRKRARKSRLCVKSEPSPELARVGKTTHRHYHRPLTPDSSPIHLLPFSPSQVARLSVFSDAAVSVMLLMINS